MKLNDRDLGIVVVGLAIVGAGVWVTISRTGAPGTGPSNMAPDVEPRQRSIAAGSLNISTQGFSADANLLGIDAKGGLTLESRLMHGFVPDGPMPLNPPNQEFVHTRHRYPTVTGTNINTLIHCGYSPLMVPSRSDYDWMVNPPSEAMV